MRGSISKHAVDIVAGNHVAGIFSKQSKLTLASCQSFLHTDTFDLGRALLNGAFSDVNPRC